MRRLAWISLGVAFAAAAWIAADELRHPQRIGIMNVVWPVTALYFSVFAVWGYYRVGRTMARDAMPGMRQDEMARRGRSAWRSSTSRSSPCGTSRSARGSWRR